MLVHQENAIRKELSTLARLCAEATQAVATEATETTTESQKGNARGLDSNEEEAVDSYDDHNEDAAESDESSVASGVSVSTTSPQHAIFTDPDWRNHSREELQEAHDDLRTVVDFMDSYLVPLRTALNDTDDTRVLYNELWHVFNPGSIVYVKDPSVPQKLWRVIQGQGGDWSPAIVPPQIDDHFKLGGSSYRTSIPPFTLDCFYIDFNGTHFVRVIRKFEIEEFKELTSVKSLSVLPLKVAEREGLVDVNSIERRGLEFLSFLQPGYCHFRGRSLSHEPRGDILKRPNPGSITSVAVLSESIESSVVVDFERCLQTITDWNPCREPRQLTTLYEGAPRPPPNVDDDRIWDLRMAEKVLNYTDQNQNLELYSRSPPAGDDVLLLPDRVFAYVLRTRKWACIPIGAGKDDNTLMRMEPKNSAWNDLQIDPRHRSIIESMMATHFRKKKSKRRQFDLIQDKGKGLIVLLHGVPGVGKTSTAETVAQYYNKPLLPITCGDLGMTPAEVETNLQDSFQLAQAWDCVLLLDEADVFLAERSQDNIERNALVSVFLHVMEYYEGILFLTTNKVGSFDEAFKSRMSLALYYPPLTQDQTEKIWRVQMERTEQLSKEAAPDDNTQHVSFNRLEIEILAKELWNLQQSRPDFKPVWNGRQIRNAFQTAVALAEWHQQENNIPGPIHVKREHFEKVALVSNEFNAYLWTVKHRRGDDILNLRKEHRFDQFDRHQFGWGGPGFGQHNQQQSGFGGWDNSQYSNTMGSRGPSGMGMGGPGFGNNMQNQSGFGNSWQSGFGGMSGAGVGGPGIATGGMGGSVMGNSALGNPNIGNSNVGAAMQPGVMSPQAIPGQNMGGQPAEGQRQQQLQQQQLQQPNIQQGGSMQSMYGQSNPQSRPSGW
ncbi:hypothetical protein CkaCkLH20_09144 [Colletotrichum karsti]|uniref:AAA+ ATPase domain-containing protein n=1 Tax=Colletotrichum karsti TaxID=1095194 RepID=A0A9P6LHM9_9PEZI|nr:uncharacterized protein CkaCkLH20_09144 [Colletotrichum karsti]KAF9873331.1 hypothetical protein CkaCkLH20_09144 [Colletotrichum karsti]